MSLWQKNESDHPTPTTSPARTPTSTGAPSTGSSSSPRSTTVATSSTGPVNIGPSIEIRGELTGNEDLTIDGRVDGKIVLKDHSLTIGANGRIKAEVQAKAVIVIGEVVGNITADDRVEVASSGSVLGDLCAPRVALADGSTFKGAIDMGRKPTTSVSSGSSHPTADVAMAAKS